MPHSTMLLSPPPLELIQTDVRRALQEDLGSGDITAALIDADRQASATVISRQAAVLCGQAWFEQAFLLHDAQTAIRWQAADGDTVRADQTLCTLTGPARSLLSAERTALNFLQTLSGTATLTREYVAAIGDLPCRLLDTRKTLPGLRQAQKYAVRCGGGKNHRMGLYDAFLIKENHIAAAGSISQAIIHARRQTVGASMIVEVEVEDLEQLEEALASGADIVLLDNMNPAQLRQAVILNAGRARLEASGNITLDNIHEIAATGVDYISTGAITKHVQAIDLSMRID